MDINQIEIVRYNPTLKKIWNDFVESSKNGTFLFNREYMDYHAERFTDHSLLIYRKGKLYCILPANIRETTIEDRTIKTLYSHQGLTYGGLIMNRKCSAEGILEVFGRILDYLRLDGIQKFIYKPVPHIYHVIPSEEDLYALFRHDAKITVRNISSTISLEDRIELNKDRREAVRRALRNGIYVRQSKDFDTFWKILEDNLKITYGAFPVHSVVEIKKLAELFPDNIKLWVAYDSCHEMLGGVVVYYTSTVQHAQYISATPEGKKKGAVDLLVASLLQSTDVPEKESYYIEMDTNNYSNPLKALWFDLGTSNEDGGRILNESLIYQKQGFGGRGVCYDTYEIAIC